MVLIARWSLTNVPPYIFKMSFLDDYLNCHKQVLNMYLHKWAEI